MYHSDFGALFWVDFDETAPDSVSVGVKDSEASGLIQRTESQVCSVLMAAEEGSGLMFRVRETKFVRPVHQIIKPQSSRSGVSGSEFKPLPKTDVLPPRLLPQVTPIPPQTSTSPRPFFPHPPPKKKNPPFFVWGAQEGVVDLHYWDRPGHPQKEAFLHCTHKVSNSTPQT